MLLDGIDDVDWKSYNHAYGTAEAVPALLRAWLSHDDRDPDTASDIPELLFLGGTSRTVCEQAVDDLWVCVFHQGDLHTAAGPMAPFLLRIVREGDIEDRATALEMLHHSLAPIRDIWEADGFDPRTHEDPAVYAAAADASTYLSIVEGAQPAHLKARAADLLGWLPADAPRIAAVLRRQLDGDAGLTCHLLLALAMADRHSGDRRDIARFHRCRDLDGPLSIAGALALARMRSVDVPGPVFGELCEALRRPSPFPEIYGHTDPFGDEPLTHLIADGIVHSMLHSPSGRPPETLWTTVLAEIAEAYGEYGQNNYLRLLAFHRCSPDDRVRLGRRTGLTPTKPDRDDDDRFHAIAPSARTEVAMATRIDPTSIGVVALGGRWIRLISLDSLAVTGTLVTDADPDHPPLRGRIDTTRVDRVLASHPGTLTELDHRLLSAAASPDGRWMAADAAGECMVWDLQCPPDERQRRAPVAVLSGFFPTGVLLAWSPDSRELATGTGPELHIWRTGEWQEPARVVVGHIAELGWPQEHWHERQDRRETTRFTDVDGATLVRLHPLRGDVDALLWLAPPHPHRPGPGFVHTDHPEALIVYRWIEHDRPVVLDGAERDRYLRAVRDAEVIRTRLRRSAWEP